MSLPPRYSPPRYSASRSETVDRQADVFVSVDFGTTYTGVAWAWPHLPMQVISNWPGGGDSVERKVPTRLVYDADGSISSWGFPHSEDDDSGVGKSLSEFFKIFIEQEALEEARQKGFANLPQDCHQARSYATDYLRKIYAHTKEVLEEQLQSHPLSWSEMTVKFLFSVPTTWTNVGTVEIFKRIITDAGFGKGGQFHETLVEHTEAEAAAFYTLTTRSMHLAQGNVFLTVDAGGGTTDLALMEVTSTHSQAPTMTQVTAVCGQNIGSSLIDRAFRDLVERRLAKHPDIVGWLPPNLPAAMSRGHSFRSIKHQFGQAAYNLPTLSVDNIGVARDFYHEGLRIEGGKMIFQRAEIQELFDQQLRGILEEIEKLLDWMQSNRRTSRVDHLILSGGLGSSAYIKDGIRHYFEHLQHPSAPRMAVIPSPDPQLVVCRGLLQFQKQLISGNGQMQQSTIARMSYGLHVMVPYDRNTHRFEDSIPDRFAPKKRWVANQIEWLIRKGDAIPSNSTIKRYFEIQLASTEETRSWEAEIWSSGQNTNELPSSTNQPGATRVCSLMSELTDVGQEQLTKVVKERKIWRNKFSHFILSFELRIIVAADIRFELWFQGQLFSGPHDRIQVTFG